MAINPGIALQSRGIKIRPFSESIESGLRMRDLLDRQQVNRMQVDEQQAKIADAEALDRAFRESVQEGEQGGSPDGGDFMSRFLQKASEYGASPQAVMAIQEKIAGQQDTKADNERQDAQLRQTRTAAGVTEMQGQARLGETAANNAADNAREDQKLMEAQYQANRPPQPAAPTGDLAKFKALLPSLYAEAGITEPTAADEIRMYRKFQEAERTPAQQIPGRDVPYPADVAKQRAEMAANRPALMGSASPDDIQETARGIKEGQFTPILTSYSFRDRTALAAALRRQGYNQVEAERDYKAVSRHLTTLNGAQQLRLRQAVSFAKDHLDVVDQLYDEWATKAKASGFKIINKATLAASAQMPGEMGALAQNLQAQINDFTSEMGTVYKGGNASTDETLRLAAGNLKADWNVQTWKKAIGLLRTSLTIRANSINTTEAAGVSKGSPYSPTQREKEPLPGTAGASAPVPGVGGTFNGEKVLKVTRLP